MIPVSLHCIGDVWINLAHVPGLPPPFLAYCNYTTDWEIGTSTLFPRPFPPEERPGTYMYCLCMRDIYFFVKKLCALILSVCRRLY